MPGAPMAVPYVLPINPNPPPLQTQASGPGKLRMLKILNISIRSCVESLSVMGVFLDGEINGLERRAIELVPLRGAKRSGGVDCEGRRVHPADGISQQPGGLLRLDDAAERVADLVCPVLAGAGVRISGPANPPPGSAALASS